MVVAADGERDRLRVGPLVVAEVADQPLRPLFQLLDLDDAVGDELHARGRDRLADLRDLDQLLRHPHRDHAAGDVLLDLLGQVEQTQPVVDVGGRLADPLGELLLVQAAAGEDRLEGVCFLDRVEVLAVQVLVDGQLERRVAVAERDRDLGESGELGGAVAALAGDQRVAALVAGGTTSGWSTPCWPIESASSASACSSKLRRGFAPSATWMSRSGTSRTCGSVCDGGH